MQRFQLVQGVVLSWLLVAGIAVPGVPTANAAAPAAKPPTVSTGSVALVSASSAMLKGSLNPHGAETSCYFQYGPTAAYGFQTAPATAGATPGEVKVTKLIAGLQSGTVYHYRLVATNAIGTTVGQDATFTTKKIPLTFKAAAAPNPVVFGNSFSISGTLSGTNSANHAVVLQANPFPYSTGFTTVGPPKLTDTTGAFAFPVANLQQNTKFRVTTLGVPAIKSAVLTELVAVRVSLHVRATGRHGYVRFYGRVAPAQIGALVGFQLLRHGHPPLNVAGAAVKRASSGTSSFSRIVRVRRAGLYRAFVQVKSLRQASGSSRALRIR
ncbi:MAG TPA: hypothetical protein VGI24_10165 [Solirubrobacteraceae bacterium]|jgi:catechol 2,3-dioxygenase-like lactoylglutathione lyase family enzyme